MTHCDYIQDEDEMDTHVQRVKTSRPTYSEMKVLRDHVGGVIGRGGSTVKEIEAKTNTSITLKNDCKYLCGHIWWDNIKVQLKEMGCQGMD